jgi:nicotinamidase-related amidase
MMNPSQLSEPLRSNDAVVICGCNFPNCPRTTIYEAIERDFGITFVPDATSAVYDRGLEELRGIGVTIRDAKESVSWLRERLLIDEAI